jgi:hypothetical protein
VRSADLVSPIAFLSLITRNVSVATTGTAGTTGTIATSGLQGPQGQLQPRGLQGPRTTGTSGTAATTVFRDFLSHYILVKLRLVCVADSEVFCRND